MAKKKIEEQLPLEAAALAEDTKKEGGVLPDEEPRNVVFEEALEAILFAAGHPISYATLARVFETTPSKVRDMVLEYSLKYNNSDIPRGVIMLVFKDSCQLCTKKYYLNEIREALGIRKSGTLSTSSMEVLAIVAYNQPVTRVFVDTLRRADSSYAMNNLLDRGLIESKGRLDAPGRPMLYGTTQDFLRSFGLKDLGALPNTSEEINNLFNSTKKADADVLENQETIDFGELIGNDAKPEETEDASPDTASEVVIDLEDELSAEDDIIDEV
jgi:segregation and condensation protein B